MMAGWILGVAMAGLAVACGSGCSSAGPYGYARTYVPTDAEERAMADAKPLDLVTAQRRPHEWTSQPVSIYVVVSRMGPKSAEGIVMDTEIHRLQKRNLCRGRSDDTCRVTVSERAFEPIRVKLVLRPEELKGPHRVRPGSLLHVIGKLKLPEEDLDEKPMVIGSFHRHWPADEYVTTAERKYLRR